MTVTQKDIATRLGVSISLVSRVLNGKAESIGVAPATVERIRETAAEMGYVPQAAARALRGAPTRTIGVLVRDFLDPFFGPLIESLQKHAHQHDYSLVLFGGEDVAAEERTVLKHGMGGVILLGAARPDEHLETFVNRKIPLVRIGTGELVQGLCGIQFDEREAFRLILDHVRNQGARKIAFLGSQQPVHLGRLELVQSLWDGAIEVVSPAERASAPAAYAAALTWNRIDADALICSNDSIALGALRALREKGIQVPSQLRVTGFDDIPESAFFAPGLTTVRQPVQRMAALAFDGLRSWMESGTAGEAQLVIAPELVIRESA